MEIRPSSVITHSFPIGYAQQWATFQIKMPRDADRLIGVEFGFHGTWNDMLSPPSSVDRVGGRLILETAEGIIYDQYVKVEEMRNPKSELGYTAWVPGFKITSINFLLSRDFHSTCREPDSIDAKAPSIVHGMFQDHWGPQQGRDMGYEFSVHLWYTIKNSGICMAV